MQTNIPRQIAMLEQIPRHPRRVTANAITEKLKDRDYNIGLRTVQRELKAMYDMGLFGLVMDDRCKPFGWSIAACWRGLNLTLMDQHMALAFHTLKYSASQLLPPQSVKQLTPYFERADQVLGSDPDNPWLYWACRVAQLPEPLPITYEEHDPKALEIVQDALLGKRQIACEIQRFIKGKSYWVDYRPINPEGIKISGGVIMLAFTVGTFHTKRYAKPINLMRNIRLLDTVSVTRDDFDIELSGEVNKSTMIDLELLLAPSASFIQRNANLSKDQSVERLQSGYYRLNASVYDTPKLREFLWGMADSVEVIAPLKLRNHFSRLTSKLHNKYQTATTESVAALG
ncbi:WYL domain-containing protein [Shewanella schlegeliana]|uniref:WYL domain-containing protein n=1 Tax=Shewanella schlegeliana TaxID=190308 RepID=A0ABS1SUS5_9GAMM|nr:WYL domain-containing protein [Shewanella schlegeliana]MBL4912085.1 WYL domain-containing protein [Shewanella schlegeliana]MCL1111317.1 WYL domain-containing protein [Shewanella schlegeliana]GIU32996.1 WYL domain-containing protein [Shewanella schlegeliana]